MGADHSRNRSTEGKDDGAFSQDRASPADAPQNTTPATEDRRGRRGPSVVVGVQFAGTWLMVLKISWLMAAPSLEAMRNLMFICITTAVGTSRNTDLPSAPTVTVVISILSG